MREQQSGLGQKQYVRKLPHLTQQQIIAAARKQAIQEADESYSGHSAGIHPEHRPYISTQLRHSQTGRSAATRAPVTFDAEVDYELEEDDEYYVTDPHARHTSTRRYQDEYELSPEQIIQRGNKRYHVRVEDIPPRKSRQPQVPPEREIYADEFERVPQQTRSRRLHPVAWLGIFGILLILGWFGLNAFTSWYQGVQDDWTYGKERHFEIDAVVGHTDSQAKPSHFTAENNNGQIIVIELPGGDISHAKIYQIETVPGNTGNPPVKLSFQDMNGDGKPDMIVIIGDGSAMIYLTLFNNGTQFVSKL